MPQLEFWLFIGALVGLILGLLGVVWIRAHRGPGVCSWGSRLVIGTLLALGGAGLLAAFYRADGLLPVGFSAGFVVIAMFIESPKPAGPEIAGVVPLDDY